MTRPVHAIDPGTSTSSIAIARPGAPLVHVRDPAAPHGGSFVRSAVCVGRDGDIVVGTAAHRARRMRPGSYRTEFKRDFGMPTAARLGDRNLRPDELTREVVAFLRTQALLYVPAEPELVVVTVPAAWEEGNRTLMRRTVAAAGYDPDAVRLLDEPVAAAAAAVPDEDPPGTHTLVYDLGGGTFDCAVARSTVDGFEVLGAPGGRAGVGGAAVDVLIMRRLRAQYPEESRALFDPAGDDDVTVLRRRIELRERCEQAKLVLSATDPVEEPLAELGRDAELVLTRAHLAELVDPLLEQTFAECERLLGVLGLGWPDIARTVPVGGSSRLPMVVDLLAKRSGRPVASVDDPELAVVRGAALHAAALAWPPPPPSPPPPAPAPQPLPVRRADPGRDLLNEID